MTHSRDSDQNSSSYEEFEITVADLRAASEAGTGFPINLLEDDKFTAKTHPQLVAFLTAHMPDIIHYLTTDEDSKPTEEEYVISLDDMYELALAQDAENMMYALNGIGIEITREESNPVITIFEHNKLYNAANQKWAEEVRELLEEESAVLDDSTQLDSDAQELLREAEDSNEAARENVVVSPRKESESSSDVNDSSSHSSDGGDDSALSVEAEKPPQSVKELQDRIKAGHYKAQPKKASRAVDDSDLSSGDETDSDLSVEPQRPIKDAADLLKRANAGEYEARDELDELLDNLGSSEDGDLDNLLAELNEDASQDLANRLLDETAELRRRMDIIEEIINMDDLKLNAIQANGIITQVNSMSRTVERLEDEHQRLAASTDPAIQRSAQKIQTRIQNFKDSLNQITSHINFLVAEINATGAHRPVRKPAQRKAAKIAAKRRPAAKRKPAVKKPAAKRKPAIKKPAAKKAAKVAAKKAVVPPLTSNNSELLPLIHNPGYKPTIDIHIQAATGAAPGSAQAAIALNAAIKNIEKIRDGKALKEAFLNEFGITITHSEQNNILRENNINYLCDPANRDNLKWPHQKVQFDNQIKDIIKRVPRYLKFADLVQERTDRLQRESAREEVAMLLDREINQKRKELEGYRKVIQNASEKLVGSESARQKLLENIDAAISQIQVARTNMQGLRAKQDSERVVYTCGSPFTEIVNNNGQLSPGANQVIAQDITGYTAEQQKDAIEHILGSPIPGGLANLSSGDIPPVTTDADFKTRIYADEVRLKQDIPGRTLKHKAPSRVAIVEEQHKEKNFSKLTVHLDVSISELNKGHDKDLMLFARNLVENLIAGPGKGCPITISDKIGSRLGGAVVAYAKSRGKNVVGYTSNKINKEARKFDKFLSSDKWKEVSAKAPGTTPPSMDEVKKVAKDVDATITTRFRR